MPCLIVALEEAYSILFVVRSDAALSGTCAAAPSDVHA